MTVFFVRCSVQAACVVCFCVSHLQATVTILNTLLDRKVCK